MKMRFYLLLSCAAVVLLVPDGDMRADQVAAIHLAAAALAQSAANGGMRTWTDSTGKYKIEAELVDCQEGEVRLKKVGGQIISVPSSRLSAADQKLIQEMLAGKSTPGGAPPDVASWVGADAVIELTAGAKTRGKIVAADDQSISLNATVGSRSYLRKYPLDRIRAVTIGGKREVLNERAAGDATPRQGAGTDTAPGGDTRRTSAQVSALIDQLGSTPPDWWDSVPLSYPQTLDLSWPQPAPEGWNNQKNVGQYVWDVINPNPGKWKEGVRLMHHLLNVNENQPQTRLLVMTELGRMYHDLLQDYARAAFWWRKAGVDQGDQTRSGVHLAECYWRLGNKQMAVDLLRKLPPTFAMIKLWADLGETQYALRMAEANTRGEAADVAYLYAGDACRVAGQHRKALEYYEKLLTMPATGKTAKRIEQYQQRARASAEAIRLFDLLELRRVPDGTYRASSPAYAGVLHVAVTVQGGRIESVEITEHQEKQFYSALTDTTRKIIEKQSVKGIDATSSATITSEAIINATAKALSAGMM